MHAFLCTVSTGSLVLSAVKSAALTLDGAILVCRSAAAASNGCAVNGRRAYAARAAFAGTFLLRSGLHSLNTCAEVFQLTRNAAHVMIAESLKRWEGIILLAS